MPPPRSKPSTAIPLRQSQPHHHRDQHHPPPPVGSDSVSISDAEAATLADDEAKGVAKSTQASRTERRPPDAATAQEDSIRAYGHVYHASGRVLLPEDASEAHRMELMHDLLKLCLDGRLAAARLPIDRPGGGLRQQTHPHAPRTASRNQRRPPSSSSSSTQPAPAPVSTVPAAAAQRAAAAPRRPAAWTPPGPPHAATASLATGVEEAPGTRGTNKEQTPPAAPFRILDVGTGTGAWAMEAARKYPSAQVLGVDLSAALLPRDGDAAVPINCRFEVADAADATAGFWRGAGPDGGEVRFDFIHIRNLIGGGVPDWRALLATAMGHLKPGGQLEFTEVRPRFFDVDAASAFPPRSSASPSPSPSLSLSLSSSSPPGSPPSTSAAAVAVAAAGATTASGKPPGGVGPACDEYQRAFAQNAEKLGVDFDPVPKVCSWLGELGAQVVRERVDWLPVRAWGSDVLQRRKGKLAEQMLDSCKC
ncbi:hypothetical protein JDV02_000305 [Purpureocillium takamizusanense]|uniref:Methyltransferase domain-containing protein n=1 Tax=Purpureocillium takamizusanense TaxID=2060973 RepID=A0A9Q8Q6U8_9HYPO|nr:uncharacterized protein JDV02_000305 [Purpureocillium takamizusanense]UNI13576.1 hypothetical protein JDV02_000305 [Purpureocillium takamizusanense]